MMNNLSNKLSNSLSNTLPNKLPNSLSLNPLTLLLIAILSSAALFSCSDDDDDDDNQSITTDTTTETDDSEALTDTVSELDVAVAKLNLNETDIAVTGDAYRISETSARVPMKINSNYEYLSSRKFVLAILYSDDPNNDLLYATNCTVVSGNPEYMDIDSKIYLFTLFDLKPNTTYYYRAYYYYNDSECGYGETLSFTSSSARVFSANAIDLGLSVKWAEYNLGASKKSQSGLYYNYGNTSRTNKATSVSELPSGDIYDTDYDPATLELGDGWRMPTYDEVRELLNNCTWQETSISSVPGYLVSGTGQYAVFNIFIPLVGYYSTSGTLTSYGSDFKLWTGSQSSNAQDAYCLGPVGSSSAPSTSSANKLSRIPIRPVYTK